MASIVVEIPSIMGESTILGYEEKLDALAIREIVEIPLGKSSGGSSSQGRTVGRTRHSDIVLTRVRDRASPKLAEACSAGDNLGGVAIHLFRQSEGENVVYMMYKLENAFVSRYESDTVDETGAAFLPHFGSAGQPMANAALGVGSLIDAPLPDKVYLAPRPVVAQTRGVAGAQDLERVSLNASAVYWTYTKYQNGMAVGDVAKGWNIQVGQSL